MAELSEVGPVLNADKTVVSTSQSQPPVTITTEHGITLKVLPGNFAQKWLGCMLSAYGSEQKSLDLQYHLQQAAKAYHASKWILKDRKVPISQRLRYFHSVVSSVACFAGGHRTMSMVNGQWSTLYAPLGSLFQAQGKSETISYVHYHLQKCKNSAKLEDHKS